jgi:hypothetical protein
MVLIRTIPRHLVAVSQTTLDAPGFVIVWGVDYVKIYKQVR